MILYTVMPEEFVLAGLDLATGEVIPEAGFPPLGGGPRFSGGRDEVLVAGASGPVRLVLEVGPGGGWRVSRLLSSDPRDYLNPGFAPGRPAPKS